MRCITLLGMVAATISLKTAIAQTPAAAPPAAQPPSATAQVPATVTPINVFPDESLMFQLGDYLGKASFVNAALVQEINSVTIAGDRDTELALLEKLAQPALNNRTRQLGYLLSVRQLMWNMRAPVTAIKPISLAIIQLRKAPVYSGQTVELAKTDPRAAFTLAVLEEYPKFSGIQDTHIFRKWIGQTARAHNGHVWYAEGLIAGFAVIAAENKKPDLLPKAPEIATDLAGQLNWITIRLPDNPSPDQLALRTKVFDLLNSVSKFDHENDYITQYQLQQLGQISSTIEGEVFGLPADSPIIPAK